MDDDRASLNSVGSSNKSGRTFGTSHSTHSTVSHSRPPSAASKSSSSVGVSEEDFIKSFDDAPSLNVSADLYNTVTVMSIHSMC